jgi:hypothetical protein
MRFLARWVANGGILQGLGLDSLISGHGGGIGILLRHSGLKQVP